MISNSGHDERGKYSGGSAGDNNGTEWQLRSWYNRPWNGILRYDGENASEVRRYIRNYAIKAANNDHIGYDQNERYTFWNQLQKNNYNPSNITTNCESDCSAGVLAICKAVGYTLGISKLQGIDHTGYTGNMKIILGNAGFVWLSDSQYRNGESNLIEGDILLNIKSHTATYVGDGSIHEIPTDNPYSREDIVAFEYSPSIEEMKARLQVLGFYSGEINRVYDNNFFSALCDFQNQYDLGADGNASVKGITWKKIDELMNGKHATIRPDFCGKDVYDMQGALNLFGYRANGIGGDYLVEDGLYGANGTTRAAVGQLQDDYGLGNDGICSANGVTWRKVNELYNNIEIMYVNTNEGPLNVRRERSTNSDIITTIAKGSEHKCTNKVNGWGYLHDVGGWVSLEYMR